MNGIPTIINNFNVYGADGNRKVGVTGECTLPEFLQKVNEIDGAGMLGVYEDVAVGQYENQEMGINFFCTSEEMFNTLQNGVGTQLTFRGSIQSKTPNGIEHIPLKIVVSGSVKGFNPGTLKKGEQMNASFTLSLTYIKITLNNVEVFELDKINSVYKVNGVDMLAQIKANC